MGKTLLFDFTVGFADPMFPIRCATVVELYDYSKWAIFMINRILQKKINFGKL